MLKKIDLFVFRVHSRIINPYCEDSANDTGLRSAFTYFD